MKNDEETLKCQDCGTEEDVHEGIDPFAHEIYNETIQITLCGNCYHERCMDI